MKKIIIFITLIIILSGCLQGEKNTTLIVFLFNSDHTPFNAETENAKVSLYLIKENNVKCFEGCFIETQNYTNLGAKFENLSPSSEYEIRIERIGKAEASSKIITKEEGFIEPIVFNIALPE